MPGPSEITVASVEEELRSPDRSRRLIAEMLEMIRAAVPAASASAERIGPDGTHLGHSVVYRGAPLRVSPEELRYEYVHHTEAEDPFHPRLMIGTEQTLTGSHEAAAMLRGSRSPFLAYAREIDMPHIVRLFLRVDGQLAGYLWLARRSQDRPFSERELDFLRRAQPFLESAWAAAIAPAPVIAGELLLAQAGLTRREADVARYASTGMRTREIADRLVLTEATVKTHLARVYRKLEVRGRAELAARVADHPKG